ncbi:MerR family transcriptional regulator [Actinomyces sp. 186855]|nr:MerR family transcriptional regulator [Actinomyces sp. AC-20-1]MCL3789254.1 MerR family transcriptional regulator [Actinomyces sp. 187325]MCL3791607.1 MerR family transcriptional regulator [Actinomyces sp. 186855]MCL3793549.1 MerR family transcriptional regulator [Actinomyces sp. 217892]
MQDGETPGAREDLTVGEAARLAGVSVRTLHHWDALGLVTPSGRTWSGYRLYSPDDVARLQQVLVYRETGMPLARIGELLDEPGTSALEHLERQHVLLMDRIARLQRMVRAVEELTDKEARMSTTPEQRAESLGTGWDPAWEAEAEQRWGQTDDWKASAERQAAQGPEERAAARARVEQVERALAAAKREGVLPGSERANALAEEHRASLTWFDVTPAKHVLLARGYVGDPRFAAHYDALEPGLASWLKEVIDANATVHGVDPVTAVWE